jgi:hypothetical protein
VELGYSPQHGIPEEVFIHDIEEDADGHGPAELVNERLGLGFACASASGTAHLWQWKMMGERDYVMAWNPATAALAAAPKPVKPTPPASCPARLRYARVELEAVEL